MQDAPNTEQAVRNAYLRCGASAYFVEFTNARDWIAGLLSRPLAETANG